MPHFINLSNHPSANWGEKQLNAAKLYGEVIDLPFPAIAPNAGGKEIDALVLQYLNKLSEYDIGAVMLQGEFVFTFRLVQKLKQQGVIVLSACSERRTVEQTDADGNTHRTSIFEFVQFREY